jgi:ethanolamine utilization protein EutN
MIIGRVTGTVAASTKIPALEGCKLMLVTPETPGGETAGGSVLAVDCVMAGIGDRVLVIDEGGSANIMMDTSSQPIRTVIAGIIDDITS